MPTPPPSARCWPRRRWLPGERAACRRAGRPPGGGRQYRPRRMGPDPDPGPPRAPPRAPQVAALVARYRRQLGTFLAPMSGAAAENALRQLARWMITEAGLAAVSDIRRDDIEDYKVWLAAQPRSAGQTITRETHRQR